jgi:Ca-activated chloride channel family protein
MAIVLVSGCQASASASPTPSRGTGEVSLEAPDEVEAGAEFEVSWTGPDGEGDYITVVAEGATDWTNEPYFYTSSGPTGTLVASTEPGEYEIWYVTGEEEILARRPITVTPFEGALQAPAEVMANTQFEVSWTGPDGPGDYVTIVAEGATGWTHESYFYTSVGPTGTLLAPVEPGAYEIWYVAADETVFASRPITVTPVEITLEAPTAVDAGADIQVTWTGPDGPGDYITIVAAGSTQWTNEPYFYTASGSPGSLTAPDVAGNYEIWYVSGQSPEPLASFDIIVR